MNKTYYGLNQINLQELSYEDFKENALNFSRPYQKDQYTSYEDGVGGSGQGSNFMPQILRELKLIKRPQEEQDFLHAKLLSFYERVKNEEMFESELIQFRFKCWGEELLRK